MLVLARKRKIRILLRRGRRARRALFPTCGVIRVAGYSVVWDCGPTPIFPPKEHQKERCGHFSVAALLHYFFHGALWNVLLSADFSAVFPRIASDFVLVNIAFEFFSS